MTESDLVFEVRKSDWSEARFAEPPLPALEPGQVRFRIDHFALTANNVSYALAGDGLGYWRFFPAADGWGRIPVMGFADVVASAHADVREGTRCFGFYPMARTLTIQPGAVSASGIVDAAPHREGLAPAYAQYLPTTGDPLYDARHEDRILLMRGLFLTAFLADDFLAERDFAGATTAIVSSASSKTSIALAFQLRQRGTLHTVGLTSERNADFVRKLGHYDEVVTYDAIGSLPRRPAVFVDMAGDGAVTSALHHHLGDDLRVDCTIGATHWTAARTGEALPGAKPEFFFAPAQIVKRTREWGAAGLQTRLGEAWQRFCRDSEAWLRVVRSTGREALARVYRDTLAGRIPPDEGQILSLQEAG